MGKPNKKWCGGCDKFLPLDMFYPRKKGSAVLTSRCKKCMNKYKKELRRR